MSSGGEEYEYSVRCQELDAAGKPCGWQYREWSGGFERVSDLQEAQRVADDWRRDQLDWEGEVQVVRRPKRDWEPILDVAVLNEGKT